MTESTNSDAIKSPYFDELGGWSYILNLLFTKQNLNEAIAKMALSEILLGNASESQIAAFAAALRVKGETVDEMSGFVAAMLENASIVPLEGDMVDTCGTGGDRSGSINVSTMAACIVAGSGAKVCKHGGRAASSKAGSADVLEELGVAIDLPPEKVAQCITEAGFGFCFAPRFHPAMRHAAPVRRALGAPTIFNLLGPLANPARTNRQVIGIGDRTMAETMLGVLEKHNTLHAMVLYGDDGMDEISTVTPSTIHETRLQGDGTYERRVYKIDTKDFGFPPATKDDLTGGDAKENSSHVLEILSGKKGPKRDIVVINAAAGLIVAGKSDDFAPAIEQAESIIDSGEALNALNRLIEISNL
ncbi:MAG: anthranilate phosphoribosyltransferase [Firmicutes bacterium]|jgi:anthranilate phosphoribosyltransferase|nr:anthranilate phosphoribosyltransferase [Bacillota bacterium]